MKEREKKPTGLIHDSQELRELILKNPGLPLLVFAGQDCNSGDYCYMSCGVVSASVGEFLDCRQEVNNEHCYTDRDEFREDLENNLYDGFKGTEREFGVYIGKILAEYDPYWKPAIIVYVDN